MSGLPFTSPITEVMNRSIISLRNRLKLRWILPLLSFGNGILITGVFAEVILKNIPNQDYYSTVWLFGALVSFATACIVYGCIHYELLMTAISLKEIWSAAYYLEMITIGPVSSSIHELRNPLHVITETLKETIDTLYGVYEVTNKTNSGSLKRSFSSSSSAVTTHHLRHPTVAPIMNVAGSKIMRYMNDDYSRSTVYKNVALTIATSKRNIIDICSTDNPSLESKLDMTAEILTMNDNDDDHPHSSSSSSSSTSSFLLSPSNNNTNHENNLSISSPNSSTMHENPVVIPTVDKSVLTEMITDLELSHRRSEDMHQLINDIIDSNKLATGTIQLHPTNIDLLKTLQTLVSSHRSMVYPNVQLNLVIGPNVPANPYMDPLRFGQVLANGLTNSAKLTQSGFISVAALFMDTSDYPDLQFPFNPSNKWLTITLCDTGPGLSNSNVDDIFSGMQRFTNLAKYIQRKEMKEKKPVKSNGSMGNKVQPVVDTTTEKSSKRSPSSSPSTSPSSSTPPDDYNIEISLIQRCRSFLRSSYRIDLPKDPSRRTSVPPKGCVTDSLKFTDKIPSSDTKTNSSVKINGKGGTSTETASYKAKLGSGLGLSGAKWLCRWLGGDIDVYTENVTTLPDVSVTRFICVLPFSVIEDKNKVPPASIPPLFGKLGIIQGKALINFRIGVRIALGNALGAIMDKYGIPIGMMKEKEVDESDNSNNGSNDSQLVPRCIVGTSTIPEARVLVPSSKDSTTENYIAIPINDTTNDNLLLEKNTNNDSKGGTDLLRVASKEFFATYAAINHSNGSVSTPKSNNSLSNRTFNTHGTERNLLSFTPQSPNNYANSSNSSNGTSGENAGNSNASTPKRFSSILTNLSNGSVPPTVSPHPSTNNLPLPATVVTTNTGTSSVRLGYNILYADDASDNIMLGSRMLKHLGCHVLAVSNSFEMIHVLKEYDLITVERYDSLLQSLEPDRNYYRQMVGDIKQKIQQFNAVAMDSTDKLRKVPFDIILLDGSMPFMDGDVAAQFIKENPDSSSLSLTIPMIAVTAHASANESEAYLREVNHVFTAVLPKPFNTDQLSKILTKVKN